MYLLGDDDRIGLNVHPQTARFISPTLQFQFTFTNHSQTKYFLSGMTYCFNVLDLTRTNEVSVGFLSFLRPYLKIEPNTNTHESGFIIMDHYILKKIEEMRAGGDLQYNIKGAFLGISHTSQGIPIFKQSNIEEVRDRISKSDWVEKYLPVFKFKNVSLLEVPIIDSKDFKKVAEYIDTAWKDKMMGEYDKVLINCRKVIEEIGIIVRKRGYKTKNIEGKEIPDWKKFFSGVNETGEIFGTINQKIYGFTSPGAHTGKSINREDADYALMITHAIANMVIKKSKSA